ncbi:hypothetical protein ACX80J_14560 [Arthrobacter sp. MDB2-24]
MSLGDLWKLIRQSPTPPTHKPEPGHKPRLDDDPEWLNQSQRAENVSRRASLESADTANLNQMHAQYYALAIGSLERSKFAAETFQKASAAIAGLYTGVLALVFSTTGNPLPLRGLVAPVFLGAAVVLSSIYLTYIVSAPRIDPSWNVQYAAREKKAYARLNTFIQDVTAIVNRQIGYLGMALAALFVGLSGIALPFLGVPALFANDPAATSTATTETPAPWPTLDPAGSGLPVELATELYKQQLVETAATRASEAAPAAPEEPGMYLLVLFAAGALITASGYALPLKGKQVTP